MAIYAYLMYLEDRVTYQCWPSYKTIGRNVAINTKILKTLGLPSIRFHDLRHIFATLALQNGVDIKTVSSKLGHYDAGFTLRTYTHATNPMQVQAAATIGQDMSQKL